MTILQGFHRHHIIPKYMGGSDAPENLVLLHPIDHAIAHLVRYKMYKNVRDKWAANWLQKIVDPEIYTEFSIDREKAIKEKRKNDPIFDQHMKKVRSEATKNRKEGYQIEAGKTFKERLKTNHNFAAKVSSNRRLAQEKSADVIRKKSELKAQKILQLRKEGLKYDQIKKIVNCSMGFISKVVNHA